MSGFASGQTADSQLILDLEAEVARLTAERDELRMGHVRLNECSGWEATKDLPLYERISKKIEQLTHEKQEADHLRQAVGAEIDVLRGRAEVAEHRRAAAEYRAQRIVLDTELKQRAEVAEARCTALTVYVQHIGECRADVCAICGKGARMEDGDCSWDKHGTHTFHGVPCTCGLADLLADPQRHLG